MVDHSFGSRGELGEGVGYLLVGELGDEWLLGSGGELVDRGEVILWFGECGGSSAPRIKSRHLVSWVSLEKE